MNLADAIRRAAQSHPATEPTPAVVQTEPVPSAFAPMFEVVEAVQAPETVAIPEPFQHAEPEETIMHSPSYEPNPEPALAGAAVRLELFLTPEQLSNLFRAVAANQHTMLTLREAASYLRVPPHTLDSLAHEGDIPGFLIDGKWRFSKAAIDEWMTAQQQCRKESA